MASGDNTLVFEEYCIQKYANSKTTPVLSPEKYDTIYQYLKNPDDCEDSKLRHYIRKNQFILVSLPEAGIVDIIAT